MDKALNIHFSTNAEPVTLIVEFAEHGDLLGVLRTYQKNSKEKKQNKKGLKKLRAYDLVKFCIQIASGMNFLHSRGVSCFKVATTAILIVFGMSCTVVKI